MACCPNCATELKTVRQRDGLFYHCQGCDGRAVTIPQIRRVCGDRFATGLLRRINANPTIGDRGCPFCRQRMRRFESMDPPLELDACATCSAVWFDPYEFEAVPEGAIESVDAARLRGIETEAVWKLERNKPRGITDEAPDDDWKTIPAFFGFPVETECSALSQKPWFTWALCLTIAAISIASFFDLDRVVDRFGFVPQDALRFGGATFLTSFFLHAGILHLVGNLYFLLIFGDNVEDCLGGKRFLLLLLASTLAGDLLHLAAQSSSDIPCVGASGGISGVIVFYALQFPKARLGFLFRYFVMFRWVQMPAWVALGLWMGLQTLTVILQVNGFSNVAATAHLGGAMAGFLLWLVWGERAMH
jgi:membrane associated rhomboid family serine protease/Zn-finger nucleic acid-binding protein